jgi:predicted Zn-dependent protease with MMP-like domain
MKRESFEALVAEAVEGLPEEFAVRLDNVAILVEDRPSKAQRVASKLDRDSSDLLGLYEGVPLTERGHNYGMVLPDRITIFQAPIEASCRNDAETVTLIRQVVLHEIAHHFGISDARLEQMEDETGRDL